MKKYIKLLSLVLALTMVLLSFASCKEEEEDEGIWTTQFDVVTEYDSSIYDLNADLPMLESNDKMFENQNYILGWDAEHHSVVLTSKIDGKKFATNPNSYAVLDDGNKNQEFVNSALVVKYSLNSTPVEIMSGSAAEKQGRVSSEQIENGIKVTYWFDEYYFAVPVEYYLDGDSVKVRLNPTDIIEASDNLVVSVGIAPFMCAAKNTPFGSKDNYLVIPSGTGAIMYTDARSENTPRSFSGKVFGHDDTIDSYQEYDVKSAVSMPFFGAKEGNNAVMGIITTGAEHAYIRAHSGDTAMGYSSAYAYVDVRGLDTIYLKGIWRDKSTDKINKVDPIEISYFTLSGENATYTGMAKAYRNYLIKNEGLTKTSENKLLNATVLGYYMEDDLFLGFPTTTAKPLTTYSETETILSELKDVTGGNMSAVLKGFGAGGVNGTVVAGNYKVTGTCGNKKAVESLINYVNTNKIDTYYDFDVVYFGSSGGGISKNNGSALNNSGISAVVRQFWISTGQRLSMDEGGKIKSLVARSKLAEVAEKAKKSANKFGFTGISFSTLGNTCYSDYRDLKYPSCDKMQKDVADIIAKTKEGGNKVLLESPVSYGATNCDAILGAPIASQKDTAFDADVPLYQIVYQGYKEIYSSAINKSNDERISFLKAIESGSGLSYVLINKYSIELRKQYDVDYGAFLYSDKKANIASNIKEAKDFLNKVKDKTIESHTILADGVTKTVFAGGTTVYVNITGSAVTTEAGVVPARNFIVK